MAFWQVDCLNDIVGNFIRHACGAFGETDHMNKELPNYINHLFDCITIGSKYKIDNGTVTFTNRWYDTVINDIYNYYGREMNRSSVFRTGTYSKSNPAMVDKWNANMSSQNKVLEVPHVSWWQIGDKAVAMTETPIGVVIDTDNMVQKGYVPYNDNNLNVPDTPQYMMTNNPAHEQTEPDGTLWSTIAVQKWETPSYLKQWRVIYKVNLLGKREVVGTYHYEDADLSKCRPNLPYPNMDARFGYVHSFAMTANFVILPETAYMFDPCAYTHYDNHKPFFPQGYSYEPNAFSRVLLMRKSDGIVFAKIPIQPMFITHQLGAYEDDTFIYMDMLTYNDSSVYDKHTYVDDMLSDNVYYTSVTRITINKSSFTLSSIRSLRAANKPQEAFEMSNINYAYYGKKYTYAYMVRNFVRYEQNAITKLNVDTNEETEYVLPEGMFAQEPQFVPRPNAVHEDDGVIISQGIDARKQKGFLVIIDARTMTLIAHVTAPDLSMFGLHNRLFPLNMGKTNPDVGQHEIIG
ncbi:Retinoid isomerohydrolase [Mactra antiquata]